MDTSPDLLGENYQITDRLSMDALLSLPGLTSVRGVGNTIPEHHQGSRGTMGSSLIRDFVAS